MPRFSRHWLQGVVVILTSWLLIGCGDGTRDSSVLLAQSDESESNDERDFPHDTHIGQLTVSDNVGWVSESQSDEMTTLWRITGEGEEEIASFREINGLSIAAGGNRFAAAVIRCSSRDDNECDQWASDLLQFSEDGELLTESTIYEAEQPLQRSDGLRLVGVSSELVWVHAPSGILAVGHEGDILEQIPWPQGHTCVFDNDLYLLKVLRQGDQSQNEPPTATRGADPSSSSLTYVVHLRDDGQWRSVSSDHTIEFDHSLRISCGADGFIVDEPRAEELAAVWHIDQGWADGQEEAFNTVPDLEDAIGPTLSADESAAQFEDGRVFVRDSHGDYVDAGLTLPALDLVDADVIEDNSMELPEDTPAPPVRVKVAVSQSAALGCISGYDGTQYRSVCEFVLRN